MLRRNHRGHHRNKTGGGPRRPQSVLLDGHSISVVRDHHDPHRGEALRHLWEEAPVPHRSRPLRRRFRHRRSFHIHGYVHRCPCRPGYRRRYPDPGRDRCRRRPVCPPREGQDAGNPRSHLRSGKRNRTPSRRIHRGSHQLALVLLHQHPPGAHRPHPHHQEVPDSHQRRGEAHRLQGYRNPDPPAPGCHPALRVRRNGVRMGQHRDDRHDHRGHRPHRPVRGNREEGHRPHPRTSSDPQQDRHNGCHIHGDIRNRNDRCHDVHQHASRPSRRAYGPSRWSRE